MIKWNWIKGQRFKIGTPSGLRPDRGISFQLMELDLGVSRFSIAAGFGLIDIRKSHFGVPGIRRSPFRCRPSRAISGWWFFNPRVRYRSPWAKPCQASGLDAVEVSITQPTIVNWHVPPALNVVAASPEPTDCGFRISCFGFRISPLRGLGLRP